ncbi:sirohydrochlorin cobaltochelatase [Oscillospiraceae bacterium 38-13]
MMRKNMPPLPLSGGAPGRESKPEAPEVEEDYTTGDASLDDVRNQDGIGEDELLVVSFGTSYNDSRRLTIGAIEAALEREFPDWSVRRAFTSRTIIDRVLRRDGQAIDSVDQALDRAAGNRVKRLVIQPTHLMDGLEYHDVANEAARYAGVFAALAVGAPLLASEEDFRILARTMAEITEKYDDGETAVCFMGHGTEAASNAVYSKMQQVLARAGHGSLFVGTVEAAPTLDDVLALVKAGNYKRVVVQPMMIVAGDHANHDMAGDGEDSWKTAFEREGYEVVCVLKGLGEYEAVRLLLADHARAAMESLG